MFDMKQAFDVVIPTMNAPHRALCAEFLSILPPACNVIWASDGKSWPEAVNLGLKKTTRDVLLMDDDIFLMPMALEYLARHYEHADIFGFKLLFPTGLIQHAGGWFKDGTIHHRYFGEPDQGQAETPVYVAHVTTSMCFIKRHVLDKLGGMAEDYPGTQFEDVDFMLRAIDAGFKILYIPGPSIHLESATKKHLPLFRIKMAQNLNELKKRFFSNSELMQKAEAFPIPLSEGNTSNGR